MRCTSIKHYTQYSYRLKSYVPFRKSPGLHVCQTVSKYRDDIVIMHYYILR